jgi:hypothetical protein
LLEIVSALSGDTNAGDVQLAAWGRGAVKAKDMSGNDVEGGDGRSRSAEEAAS